MQDTEGNNHRVMVVKYMDIQIISNDIWMK